MILSIGAALFVDPNEVLVDEYPINEINKVLDAAVTFEPLAVPPTSEDSE